MSDIDLVKAGLASSESGDAKRFSEYLSDDMVFSGPTPQPVGKREFVGLMSALVSAMPDFKFNARDFKHDGDRVFSKVQITGTQTGELNLPMPGFQRFLATGKRVALPQETMTITVRNGLICRIESDNVPGGGVAGILSQLGVPMPQIA